MENTFRYDFQVRGYELDSFGHVNNSVYINYLEQARWEIIRELDLLDYFKSYGHFLVVIETKIKYINELNLFDEAYVKTRLYREGFFIVFKQDIFMKQDHKKIAKSDIKCLFVDKKRAPQDIPKVVFNYLMKN